MSAIITGLKDIHPQVWVLAGVCLVLGLRGISKIKRARLVHRVGRISYEAFRAQMALGVLSIVFVPLVIVAVVWMGYVAAMVLTLAGFAVEVWAHETLKESHSRRD